MPENPFVYPSSQDDDARGETLRDKYAGLAPWDIPEWFKPSGVYDAPEPVIIPPDTYFGQNEFDSEGRQVVDSNITAIYQGYYDSATETWDDAQYLIDQGDQGVDQNIKNQVEGYTQTYKNYINRYNDWNLHYQKERYFQWRWYYSDEMLLKREGDILS